MKWQFGILVLLIGCFSCKKNEAVKQPVVLKPVMATSSCYTPATTDSIWYTTSKKAPLFKGLQVLDFKISTHNTLAQEYFNQGLLLAYGFNHAEAARSFHEVTKIDSTCAMGYWGYAYVLGPNYNGGMEKDNFQRAFQAVNKAKELAYKVSPKEKALIFALSQRYARTPPDNRQSLDQAYATAMDNVYRQFPDDPDIGALYAESLLDLHPWDLYEKNSKAPKKWTLEITKLLEELLKKHLIHPGIHHFYIHAIEASASPEKALKSAKILDTLVKGAGHLVHMPSHIYINTGDYHLGTLANIKAIKADSLYTTVCHAQGIYPLAYYPHNIHFLVATAALEGNSKLAWKAALQLQKHTAVALMDQEGWSTLQHYYTIPYYTAVKLQLWDTILKFPIPQKKLTYPMLMWHYARAMAYLHKKDLKKAKDENNRVQLLAKDTSLANITIWDINTTADLAQIAALVAQANINWEQGNPNKTIQLLTKAVALEDNLNYNEPPDWFFSVRYYLGTFLWQSKQYAKAEIIFKEDLKKWKKNGWALYGLYQSLEKQNKRIEAIQAKADFEKAWQYADFKLQF
ncbi:tetratricopeptide repeat protein [Flavobacterium agrisoli]|uniref:Tetratricopeptide repeat protein n=1 Tax=Flavobacterium agrisoli TaxID=2793066 RepID=A0A934PMV5_9FLAO|nr:hypothetical protein [Flavobacterium agrisoli]MBK0371127.1 hypothetical protein [Flavobacterium agrisoli]